MLHRVHHPHIHGNTPTTKNSLLVHPSLVNQVLEKTSQKKRLPFIYARIHIRSTLKNFILTPMSFFVSIPFLKRPPLSSLLYCYMSYNFQNCAKLLMKIGLNTHVSPGGSVFSYWNFEPEKTGECKG